MYLMINNLKRFISFTSNFKKSLLDKILIFQQALIGLIAICVLFIGTLGFLCLRSQKAYNTILFDKNLPR